MSALTRYYPLEDSEFVDSWQISSHKPIRRLWSLVYGLFILTSQMGEPFTQQQYLGLVLEWKTEFRKKKKHAGYRVTKVVML